MLLDKIIFRLAVITNENERDIRVKKTVRLVVKPFIRLAGAINDKKCKTPRKGIMFYCEVLRRIMHTDVKFNKGKEAHAPPAQWRW